MTSKEMALKIKSRQRGNFSERDCRCIRRDCLSLVSITGNFSNRVHGGKITKRRATHQASCDLAGTENRNTLQKKTTGKINTPRTMVRKDSRETPTQCPRAPDNDHRSRTVKERAGAGRLPWVSTEKNITNNRTWTQKGKDVKYVIFLANENVESPIAVGLQNKFRPISVPLLANRLVSRTTQRKLHHSHASIKGPPGRRLPRRRPHVLRQCLVQSPMEVPPPDCQREGESVSVTLEKSGSGQNGKLKCRRN